MVLILQLKDEDLLNGLQKQYQIICCLQETHFTCKNHSQIEGERMETDIPRKWKQARVAILIKNLNRSIMSNEIKVMVKSLPTKKSPGLDEFYVAF
jgi:hypothetical protein